MAEHADRLYLGFDFSTQQIKVVVIDNELKINEEFAVRFGADLPEFGTQDGVHIHEDKVTVTSPTLMWVKALDILLDRMKEANFQFEKVAALAGSGQQHGSVYWKRGAEDVLKNLNPDRKLHEQLKDCFSVQNSPIWMDASTTEQCKMIEQKVGGAKKLAEITGARAYERLTGIQIAKIFENEPEAYNISERISLVSSFATSLFLGRYGSIDLSDGSGMNLLDIRSHDWSQGCLDAAAPDLRQKLGAPVASHETQGPISSFYVKKYNFNPECKVVSFTGDNPASLSAFVPSDKDVVLSLGSSDTLLLTLEKPLTALEGNILVNPMNPDIFMALLCFKNGSLMRQSIRDRCAEEDWDKFADHLASTPMGNNGHIGIYFDVTEVQPLVMGTFRFNENDEAVNEFSDATEVRAIIESQFMSRKIHAKKLGFELGDNTKIIATGGASANNAILQVASDIFNVPVYTTNVPNSAALGAAYRAKHGLLGGGYTDVIKGTEELVCVAKPTAGAQQVYGPLTERYSKIEGKVAKDQGDPNYP